MSIKIRDCRISECGTAIVANGKVDVDISKTVFKDNLKDIDLNVHEDSNIDISEIESINCKSDSITIREYEFKIEDIINQINSMDIDKKAKKKIIRNLKEIPNNKDDLSKLKSIRMEIYSICKGIGIPTIAQGICKALGWN